MKLSPTDLKELAQYAREAAQLAGAVIMTYANKKVEILTKSTGSSEASQVLTEVDLRCEKLILDHLDDSVRKYNLAVLSEEQEDDKQRLIKEAFWCIDPIDGTLAFTQARPGYSVSIALVSKTGKSLIGVVYDPVKDRMYSAITEQGLYLNGQAWRPENELRTEQLTLPCDRSLLKRPDFPDIHKAIDQWRTNKGLTQINEIHHCGAVMNAIQALENPPACYFKPPKKEDGGGSLWDFAATACICSEAGAFVCDYKGQVLELNKADSTFMNQNGVIFSTEKELVAVIQSLYSD
jgi:fructose-1,6-bisphosphatase/inositol monophosphatase family enzyme